jgi:hypothetical protein
MVAIMEKFEAKMMAKMDAWIEELKAYLGVTEACLEKREPTPEEMEAVVEHQKVPEGATHEETIGATGD